MPKSHDAAATADMRARPEKTALATLKALTSNAQTGLASVEAEARHSRDGANEVPESHTNRWLAFARKFWGLSAWMLELIAVLSLILHKYADFAVTVGLLLVNAILSFLQEQRASAAVAALRRQLQVTARTLRDGSWQALPARELVCGDIVRVRSGDFVPADVQLLDGELHVDQSALTGESQEQQKAVDGVLYAGSTVRQGEATGIVVAIGVNTYFGRTTQLVQSARPKLHVEAVISRVVQWLFLIVGVQVAAAFIMSMVEGLPLLEILPLTLVLLMGAVPVALPVMFTVTMALGSVELARRGVLITRLSAAEDAANMDVLCADKTGTLTMNRLSLTHGLPNVGFTENEILYTGALASHEADQDPIDMAFLRAARERNLFRGDEKTHSFVPFSAKTRRTEAQVETNGQQMRVMKGALRTVADLASLDAVTIAALEQQASAEAQKGVRNLAVARAQGDGPWQFVGLALLRDEMRADSGRLIGELRSLGVTVKMLTGDALAVAVQVARELNLGEVVRAPDLRRQSESQNVEVVGESGGFAEMFPEDKFLVVQNLQAAGHVVGMTGDGVNDTPALRQAEVGIAVSGCTDVAKGAASVVLTTEGLASIVDLVKNGRAIYQRVLTWIINKVSRTILKTGFVVIAFLATGKFVVSPLAMVTLVFMTDFVKIALSTDRVRPSQKPETWNIGPLVTVAVFLGVLMLVEALAMLALGWHFFDLDQGDGRLATFSFLILLFFAIFSIVSIRERRYFWSTWPSSVLAAALFADGCVGAMIGIFGFAELTPLPMGHVALIVLYSLICSLGINDLVKKLLIARI